MRKLIWLLVILLTISCAAQAEEYHYTRRDDLYYHVSANCGGADGMVPISMEGAQEFDKFPCPICVPDDTQWQADIAAVARDNTVIVRIADSFLEEAELTDTFGFSPAEPQPVSEAPALIAEYLHGDAYNRFLQEIRTTGSASAQARIPLVLSTNTQEHPLLRMSTRHIGNAWYVTFLTENGLRDGWDLEWRIEGYTIEAKDDQLTIALTGKTDERSSSIPLVGSADLAILPAPKNFSVQFDGCRIEVYPMMNTDTRTNIARITQFDADADYLQNSTLCIGDQIRIPINGYADGADGIFWCALTDVEYACLANGTKATILPPNYMDSAEFDNSPYAAVRRGTGGVGIVDASGAFVVQPEYQSIVKYRTADYPTTVPIPFFCTAEDGAITILDSQTLDVLAQYPADSAHPSAAYLNPSAFEIRDGTRQKIMSLMTGDKLFDVPEGTSVDVWYRCMADGYPERLVLRDGAGAKLITLTGEPVSDSYTRITPLIWKDGRGAFLVETRDSDDTNAASIYFERGKTSSVSGTSWRCGLMDENGKIIVPVTHTSVEVTDDLRVIFDGVADATAVAID